MAWKETCRVEERLRFVLEYYGDEPPNLAALCRAHGVSRKTGYKWLQRWESEDPSSLLDRSRRPLSSPHATHEKLEQAIVDMRKLRPSWGPKKLRWAIAKMSPNVELPSVSTFANIIKRHGLVVPKRHRTKTPPFTAPFAGCNQPNDVWCADFKGHFPTGRTRCYPLTMSDGFSRYLLRCEGLRRPRHQECFRVFESAFREFGLPRAMRTDNGPPFASTSVGGLSKLAVWWMRLGIRPERIAPGKPQQNGRHERMHRTLKAETAQPPSPRMRAQQQRFDTFRRQYNDDRPHEALGLTTPAEWYAPSPRPYPERLPPVEYPFAYWTQLVPENGILPWRGENLYISTSLANEYIGVDQVRDNQWDVYHCTTLLGRIEPMDGPRKKFRFEREKFIAPQVEVDVNEGDQREP
jgi:putative transposase